MTPIKLTKRNAGYKYGYQYGFLFRTISQEYFDLDRTCAKLFGSNWGQRREIARYYGMKNTTGYWIWLRDEKQVTMLLMSIK